MKIPHGVRTAIGVILAFLVFAVLSIMWFEEKLIYFPSRPLDGTPEDAGLAHEDVELVTDDGVRLHGWFVLSGADGGSTPATVLMCHGNAGNISHRLERAMLLTTKLGVDVLLFDYRGYGLSEGAPTEEGTYQDVRAAYRYLTEDRSIPPERIVLFGESLGTAIALQLAIEAPAAALVLEAPFTSIPDMAREVYPFLPFVDWIRTRYDSASKISRLRMPVLVIHGEEDRVVPYAHGAALFERAPEPKTFFGVAGGGHSDLYATAGSPYWSRWREHLTAAVR